MVEIEKGNILKYFEGVKEKRCDELIEIGERLCKEHSHFYVVIPLWLKEAKTSEELNFVWFFIGRRVEKNEVAVNRAVRMAKLMELIQ